MPSSVTIALYSGIIVEGDGVSSSLRAKLAALRMANRPEFEAEVVAFCQYSDVDDPAIQVTPTVPDLLTTSAFHRASLHIFEFGIYYQLFNVALLMQREQMAAIYHNITPRRLVQSPMMQAAIDRSMDQKHLLARMSHVACDSEFNRQDLLAFGIPADALSVLPLPVGVDGYPAPPRGHRPASDPIRFLFVGRLVRAKGVLDLLAATRALVDSGTTGFEVCLIGRMDGSDSVTTEAIGRALEASPIAGSLRFMPDATSDELSAAYRDADVFVMPSYHEGYCIPIAEAFNASCPVIAYDNTNIPAVSAGLAELIPTGDVAALARAMQRSVADLRAARQRRVPYRIATPSGEIPEPEWSERAQQHVSGLRIAHDEGFVALVRKLLASSLCAPTSTATKRHPTVSTGRVVQA